MSKRIGPITLDGDTADRITVLALKEHRTHRVEEKSSIRCQSRRILVAS